MKKEIKLWHISGKEEKVTNKFYKPQHNNKRGKITHSHSHPKQTQTHSDTIEK